MSISTLRVELHENLTLAALRARSQLNPRAQLASVRAYRSPVQELGPAFEMFVHDPNECVFISRLLLQHGTFESSSIAFLLSALHAANGTEAFLDIGSNVGVYALSVAAAGFAAVGFEPLRYNTELIAASAARNSLGSRLRLYKMAAAAKPSESMCVRSNSNDRRNRGNGQLGPLSECGDGNDDAQLVREVVPALPIDAVIASDALLNTTCWAALKVDVEGFEVAALRGATRVMRGSCPPCALVIEYVPYHNTTDVVPAESTGRNPLPLLANWGYHCRKAPSRHFFCSNEREARCTARVSGARAKDKEGRA